MQRILVWLPVLLGCGLVFFLYRATRPAPTPSPAAPSQAERQRRWQQQMARLQAQGATRERFRRKADEEAFHKTLARANRLREQDERAAPADALPGAPAAVRAYAAKMRGLTGVILNALDVIGASSLQSMRNPSLVKEQRWWLKIRAASTRMKSAAGGLRQIRPVPAELRHSNQRIVEAGTKIQASADEYIRATDARDPWLLASASAGMQEYLGVLDQIAEEVRPIMARYR
jgi:hypothetical protein